MINFGLDSFGLQMILEIEKSSEEGVGVILFKFSHREMRRRAPLMALLMSVWYGGYVEYCATYNEGICKYPFLHLV